MESESIDALINLHRNTVLVIPNDEYNELIWDAVQSLSRMKKQVLYVSVNKSIDAIVAGMREKGIATDNFYFIDTISKTVISEVHSVEGVKASKLVFMNSPADLETLGSSISKLLVDRKIGVVFIDSLSTLLIYNEDVKVIKFAHFITEIIERNNGKGLFTILKKDVSSEKIKDLGLFVDKVQELGTTQFEDTSWAPSVMSEVRLSRKIALPVFGGFYVIFAFVLSYALFFTSGIVLEAEVVDEGKTVLVVVENTSGHVINQITVRYLTASEIPVGILFTVEKLNPGEVREHTLPVPADTETMLFEASAPFHQLAKESVRVNR